MNAKMKKLSLVMGLLALSGMASAGTATQGLSVSAIVSPSCVFGAPATLDFGTLALNDLLNGKTDTGAAAVKITCTAGGGTAKLYGGATRTMTSVTLDTLAYEVYTDAARLLTFGSSNAVLPTVLATGVEQTINLYGKTAASQGTKTAGTYSQSLLLTVEF